MVYIIDRIFNKIVIFLYPFCFWCVFRQKQRYSEGINTMSKETVQKFYELLVNFAAFAEKLKNIAAGKEFDK